MIRDNRPLGFVPLGGHAGTPENPSGWGYASDYWATRQKLVSELTARPWTRYQLNCLYGTASPLGAQPAPSWSVMPYHADDIAPWLKPALRDSCKEAQQIRPGITIDPYIGFCGSDPQKFASSLPLFDLATDLDWVVRSCRAWRNAGMDGLLSIDASSHPPHAAHLAAIDAKWPHGIMLEAIPLVDGQPDVGLLSKYPAWCRREFVDANMAPGAIAPQNGFECIVVWNHVQPSPWAPQNHAAVVEDMKAMRARGFVLGGDVRYDAAMQEAMA